MAHPAIITRSLGKRYVLGEDHRGGIGRKPGPETLSEAVVRRLHRVRRSGTRAELWALHDLSIEIDEGDVVGFIGRNGSGKSTLLKLLTRITTPTTGSASIRGRVGALLEVGTGFHPELTGRENVFLNGALLGMTRRDILRRFDAIVDFAGTERFLDTPVKRYSTGMQLRLAFAVAAHLEPDVLIVDEVLAVGDAEFQARCLGRMAEAKSEGRTVLFVSHDLGALQSLCRRGIWLSEGRVRLDGRAGDVVASYLESGAVPEAKAEFSDFSVEDGPIRPLLAWMSDLEGMRITRPRSTESFNLNLVIEVREKTHGLDVAFYLRTRRGLRLVDEALSETAGTLGGATWQPGTYQVSMRMPGILAAQRYGVGLWVGNSQIDIFDDDIFALHLLPGPHDGSGWERERAVRPEIEWNVSQHEKSAGRGVDETAANGTVVDTTRHDDA